MPTVKLSTSTRNMRRTMRDRQINRQIYSERKKKRETETATTSSHRCYLMWMNCIHFFEFVLTYIIADTVYTSIRPNQIVIILKVKYKNTLSYLWGVLILGIMSFLVWSSSHKTKRNNNNHEMKNIISESRKWIDTMRITAASISATFQWWYYCFLALFKC